MTRDENDVVQLLIDAGVLTFEDGQNIESIKGEVLLQHMIDKRVLLPSEIEEARGCIMDVLTRTNHSKRIRAKISLIRLITTNLHRRMDMAGEQMRTSKEKITSESYAAITAAQLAFKTDGK